MVSRFICLRAFWGCVARCKRVKNKITLRINYAGGGPAPLLDNPGVGTCVVFFALEFLYSLWSVGVLIMLVFGDLKGCIFENSVSFAALEILVALLSAAWFLYVSFIRYTSDDRWTRIVLGFVVKSGVDTSLIFYGVSFLLDISEQACQEPTPVSMLVLGSAHFGLASLWGLIFLLVFLPRFALQSYKLREFK
eukprot:TRINITY_DN64575_c0_g1_i1.p1 TRINITY_DN64575_c0_g1~~TRINITY_DN64575_c0_g1_i1.p1  ORF type:complete len:193 (-),score=9.38 TRINITY_DN64575_c0_g1_i1:152-730(-)